MNHHYEEIFCYYGLRESSKKRTTQKSLRVKKKRLVRCGECGKGFRYEKCLRNHSETMHSLEEKKKKKKSESMGRDLLCFFRSGGVQRRKRSKRVSRYKKSLPPLSVSSSSSSSPSSSPSLYSRSDLGFKLRDLLAVFAADAALRPEYSGSS